MNNLDLAISWLHDFDQHVRDKIVGKTAEDNLDTCLRLLEGEDAEKLFAPELLNSLKQQVSFKRVSLIKEAESKIKLMKRGL